MHRNNNSHSNCRVQNNRESKRGNLPNQTHTYICAIILALIFLFFSCSVFSWNSLERFAGIILSLSYFALTLCALYSTLFIIRFMYSWQHCPFTCMFITTVNGNNLSSHMEHNVHHIHLYIHLYIELKNRMGFVYCVIRSTNVPIYV